MNIKQVIGKTGENKATAYLQSIGYKIYRRNVRIGKDEIDIVCFDPSERVLVFAEVKTRSQVRGFSPLANITPTKKKKLFRAARRFMGNKGLEMDYRIDVVSVIGNIVECHLQQLEL